MTYTWIRMGEPRLRGKVRGPAVEPPGPEPECYEALLDPSFESGSMVQLAYQDSHDSSWYSAPWASFANGGTDDNYYFIIDGSNPRTGSLSAHRVATFQVGGGRPVTGYYVYASGNEPETLPSWGGDHIHGGPVAATVEPGWTATWAVHCLPPGGNQIVLRLAYREPSNGLIVAQTSTAITTTNPGTWLTDSITLTATGDHPLYLIASFSNGIGETWVDDASLIICPPGVDP